MQREDDRRERRARHREPAQDRGEQARRKCVQRDVDKVIAERVVTPEPVKDPERGVRDRVVLLRRSGVEPDPAQSVE